VMEYLAAHLPEADEVMADEDETQETGKSPDAAVMASTSEAIADLSTAANDSESLAPTNGDVPRMRRAVRR